MVLNVILIVHAVAWVVFSLIVGCAFASGWDDKRFWDETKSLKKEKYRSRAHFVGKGLFGVTLFVLFWWGWVGWKLLKLAFFLAKAFFMAFVPCKKIEEPEQVVCGDDEDLNPHLYCHKCLTHRTHHIARGVLTCVTCGQTREQG